jgi:catechol 2,3-dioxygenase-like lactoylglutathione lyase family enzyme
MHIRGTDFVMFLVSDLPRAVGFYRDVLGVRCEIDSAEYQWAEFDCGNVTLSLKGNAAQSGEKAGGNIALAVKDVAKAHRELTGKGVQVEGPIDSGCCIAIKVRDPDGNLVILHERADGSYGNQTNCA